MHRENCHDALESSRAACERDGAHQQQVLQDIVTSCRAEVEKLKKQQQLVDRREENDQQEFDDLEEAHAELTEQQRELEQRLQDKLDECHALQLELDEANTQMQDQQGKITQQAKQLDSIREQLTLTQSMLQEKIVAATTAGSSSAASTTGASSTGEQDNARSRLRDLQASLQRRFLAQLITKWRKPNSDIVPTPVVEFTLKTTTEPEQTTMTLAIPLQHSTFGGHDAATRRKGGHDSARIAITKIVNVSAIVIVVVVVVVVFVFVSKTAIRIIISSFIVDFLLQSNANCNKQQEKRK